MVHPSYIFREIDIQFHTSRRQFSHPGRAPAPLPNMANPSFPSLTVFLLMYQVVRAGISIVREIQYKY